MFSGIGAPEMAMPHWNWAWCAEIEKFPSAVLAARHSHSINLGDVTADDFCERAAAIARPDVVVFGSPCQSFSIAGRRLGLDDPRGNLALVALRIVARLAPRWFVFENVPGLLSSAEGSDFGVFLRAVDDIGYSGAWASLDAQWFGVAQRRKRLFFVGHSGDWRRAAAVLLEPESLCGDHPPRREARQRPAGCLEACARGTFGTDFMCDGGLIADPICANEQRTYSNSGNNPRPRNVVAVAPMAFSSKDHGADAISDLAPTLRAGTHDRSHANAGVPPAIAIALRGRDGGSTAELSEVPSALRASQGGGDKAHVLAYGIGSDAVDRSGEGAAGNAAERSGLNIVENCQPSLRSRANNSVATASAVRRLTPRECERLQGFYDDYTLIEYRGKQAADGPRYKALGNSMAVPVMRWILSRIERVNKLALNS